MLRNASFAHCLGTVAAVRAGVTVTYAAVLSCVRPKHLGAVSDALRKDTHSALQESEEMLWRYRKNNRQWAGMMEERQMGNRKMFCVSDVMPTTQIDGLPHDERVVLSPDGGHVVDVLRPGMRGCLPNVQKPLTRPEDWETGRSKETLLGKTEHFHEDCYITGPAARRPRLSSLRMIQAVHGQPVHRGPHTTKFYIGQQ